MSCLKCGTFRLKVIAEFDSDAGELKVRIVKLLSSSLDRDSFLEKAGIRKDIAVVWYNQHSLCQRVWPESA